MAAFAAIGLTSGLLYGCGGGGAQQQQLASRAAYVAHILPNLPGSAQQNSEGYALSRGAAGGEIVVPVGSVNAVHAAVWQNPSSEPIDINPPGFESSRAAGISSGAIVGWASMPSFLNLGVHAFLWATAASAPVDLTPPGYFSAEPTGISGKQQCGFGSPVIAAQPHALLWTGSAASAVDLTPSGFTSSVANGTDGTFQVGSVTLANGDVHAAMWSGTAASLIDLTSSGFGEAYGVSNGHQVGAAAIGNNRHATVWNGTSASAVDLHPRAGFLDSAAVAVAGNHQVGYGILTPPVFTGPSPALITHALVWSGTAASVVDLDQFLPGTGGQSRATGIDENGNIIGVASIPTGANPPYREAAVVWVPQVSGR
jgi:hypothetical protein